MKKLETRKTPKKIKELMVMLGCTEVHGGIFRHPGFAFDFDMSATGENKILERLWCIFSAKGYEKFQEDFRHLIGIK